MSTDRKTFSAYTGTLLENYQAGAQRNQTGIAFRKRHPGHRFKDLYYTDKLPLAVKFATQAVREANELAPVNDISDIVKDNLVILEGKLGVGRRPASYERGRTMAPEEPFPVERIWMLRDPLPIIVMANLLRGDLSVISQDMLVQLDPHSLLPSNK